MQLTAEMFSSLLESAPCMVLFIDKDGVIQFVNYTPPGLSVDKVVGTKQIDFVEPQHRELVQAAHEKAFSSGECITYETQGAGPDGGTAWYSSTVGPVRRDGKIVGVAIFTTDISAQKTAEDELRKAKDDLIHKQARAIQELSTPVIQVWNGILILPLIGVVDTARGQQVTEQLLEAVVSTQASVAIIDVTGVPVVDSTVAGHLLKTIQAATMLGTHAILTGVSSHNAQTLVRLGVDLSQVTTKGTLQAGLKTAFQTTNRTIVTNGKPAAVDAASR